MENTEKQSLTSLMDIGRLDPARVRFTFAEGGYADMEYDGKKYSKVKIIRALPHQMPTKYICISDGDGNEIGMIRDTAELDEISERVVRAELEKLYFSPEIIKVNSVKDSMGFMYFDTETKQGKRSFAVSDVRSKMRFMDNEKKFIQITDADGNRYHISDFSKLDPASKKRLDPFLL